MPFASGSTGARSARRSFDDATRRMTVTSANACTTSPIGDPPTADPAPKKPSRQASRCKSHTQHLHGVFRPGRLGRTTYASSAGDNYRGESVRLGKGGIRPCLNPERLDQKTQQSARPFYRPTCISPQIASRATLPNGDFIRSRMERISTFFSRQIYLSPPQFAVDSKHLIAPLFNRTPI